MSSPRETPVLQAIRAAVVALPDVNVWRSNTGVDLARGVRYGLGVGGADLVGIITVITEMGPLGRFFGLEVKRPRGKGASLNQRIWAKVVRDRGGFVAVVRSPEDALAAMARARHPAFTS